MAIAFMSQSALRTLVLLPVIIQFATRYQRTFLESVNVRLQNSELMEQLRQQKEAAEEANIAKSRFLAVASHDLRQPLHALGLFVQALQESSIASHERHIVGNIRRSVDAMEELFDALLDISRLDAGVVRPRFETFGLATLFDRLSFEYGPVARQKGLSLRVMKTSVYICSDPSLFDRIARNLVSNAIRYTDRGGVLLGCRRQRGACESRCGIRGAAFRPTSIARFSASSRNSMPPIAIPTRGWVWASPSLSGSRSCWITTSQLRSKPGKGSVFCVAMPRGREEDVIANTSVEQTTAFDLTAS